MGWRRAATGASPSHPRSVVEGYCRLVGLCRRWALGCAPRGTVPVMAVARNAIPHLRLVFGGTTGAAAQEIWACTLKLIPCIVGTPPVPPSQSQAAATVASLTPADITTALTGMVTAVQTMWAELGGQSFFLDYAKLNAYGENDLQVTDPTIQQTFTSTEGGIPCSTPWSSALDLYHRTSNANRGFATHGRLSLPTGLDVDLGTGKIDALGAPASSPSRTLAVAATTWVTFLEALRTASPDSRWYPGILYTSTNVAKPPTCNIVDRIIVSDIPGEVRTRQNALVQGSSKVNVTYP